MRINNNISALNAWRGLTQTDSALGKSLEKLSSGLRINRAGDDAAGLAISEKMRGQIKGLNQAVRNAQDGISLIQTAEGALNETHSILQRMRELATQAANDTNTSVDREEIQKEINQLTSELNRIANTTEFNTLKLLDGSKATASTPATPEVPANPGSAGVYVYTGTFDGTANISIDGVNLTGYTDLDGLVGKINADGTLGAKYTAENDGGKLKLTQKTGNFSATEPTVADLALDSKTDGVAPTAGTPANPGAPGTGLYFQIGANGGQGFEITIGDMRAAALFLTGTAGGTVTATSGKEATYLTAAAVTDNGALECALDVSSYEKATAAIDVINDAIEKVSTERSKLGAYQNRLEHTINNLGVAAENLTAAESRIRDVDMASEMMNMTRQNILTQAGTAMLAQANQRPQAVLQLLR